LNSKGSFAIKLEQIQHINPSQFSALKSCPLRVVFSSTHIPRYLPASPSTRLGTIVHKVVEIAGVHQFDETTFEELWHSKVQEQEQQMKQSWFERHLIPLHKTALDYDVKKRQCFLLLRSLKSPLAPMREIDSLKTLKEHSLKSRDGLIIGRADKIRTEQDGTTTIIDYKTGKIHRDKKDTKWAPEYEEQLKLYAALFNEEYNKWPSSLAVITLDGQKKDINFNETECAILLEQCRKELLAINSIIAGDESLSTKTSKLAYPSPAKCRYCLHRPICEPYFDVRQRSLAKDWPLDIWGEVKEKKVLLNGLGKITLVTLLGAVSNIRGLKIDRQPALAQSNKIAIFSLQNDGSENNFKEGQFTTIYGI
jgi:hypothetical protein